MSFQRLTTAVSAQDEFGVIDPADDANWNTFLNRWCKVHSQGGSEFYKANQQHAKLSLLLETHYDVGTKTIKPSDRVQHGDRTYEILNVFDPDGRFKTIRLACTEVVGR
jgi:SPP1 family predicted phage head-tail adaptor